MANKDTHIQNLIINYLTKSEYDAAVNAGTINSNELYMVTDVQYPSMNDIAKVALSGEYSDLINTPTIPTVDQVYNASSTNAQSGTAVANAITNMQLTSNMVDVVSNTSTNTTYPTASAVYNIVGNIEALLHNINSGIN